MKKFDPAIPKYDASKAPTLNVLTLGYVPDSLIDLMTGYVSCSKTFETRETYSNGKPTSDSFKMGWDLGRLQIENWELEAA
jgi:hypothetical protein